MIQEGQDLNQVYPRRKWEQQNNSDNCCTSDSSLSYTALGTVLHHCNIATL